MNITGAKIGSGARIQDYTPPIITNNLLMNLDANSGISGSSWTDSSGNGYTGTIYNSPSTSTVNGFTVLNLNGSSQYVLPTAGFGTLLNTSSGYTFDVWVNPTSITNGTILAEWGDSALSSTWTDAQMGIKSTINAGYYSGGSVTGPTATANNWYNIVFTYNSTNKGILYVNGVSQGQTSATKSNPPSGATYITLGHPDSNGSYLGGLTGYFTGSIGAWKVYTSALTQTQVTQNFTALRWRYGI